MAHPVANNLEKGYWGRASIIFKWADRVSQSVREHHCKTGENSFEIDLGPEAYNELDPMTLVDVMRIAVDDLRDRGWEISWGNDEPKDRHVIVNIGIYANEDD